MKRLLLLLTLLVFMSTVTFSQMIFDHTFVDETQIPANYIELVKDNVCLQWVGASHGHQVMTGIELAELDNPLLDATVSTQASGWCLPDTGPFRCMNGYIPYYTNCNCTSNWGGPQAFWEPPKGPEAMDKLFIQCGYDVNVAGWTWCTELHNGSYNLQAYFDQMEIYEDIYPWCTFIYSTATTEYQGDQGWNRWNNNNIIRQYCLDNNKILFDFADIECWYNGEFSYYIHNGDTVPTRHSAYPDEGYHHTNYLNCANKGRVIWSMMAYIEGWNPTPPPNEAPAFDKEYQIFAIHIPNVTGQYYVGQLQATDPDGNIDYGWLYSAPEKLELGEEEGDVWLNHVKQTWSGDYDVKSKIYCIDDGIPPLTDEGVLSVSVKFGNPPSTLTYVNKNGNLYISNEIIVYDLSGRVVLKVKNEKDLKQELLTLKNGIYFYKEDNEIKKLIR